jgi:adenylate cyclase
MVRVLFEFGGTLDKFIGDGILATFGTPVALENSACSAVEAALKIRQEMIRFNNKRKAAGLTEIRHGIGIHTGTAIVGNIGIADRLEYTVIGDTVNTASRIESHSKVTGHDILLSEETVKLLPADIRTEFADEVILKGKKVPVRMFSLPDK